jgi:hypothetical protein
MPSYQFQLNGQPIRGGDRFVTDGPAVLSCVSDHPIGWWSINWDGGDNDGNNISSVPVGPNQWRYEQTLEPGSYTVRCSASATDTVAGGTEGGWIVFDIIASTAAAKPVPAMGVVTRDVKGVTIDTVTGGPIGIEINADDLLVKDVAFTSPGGYLVQINRDGCVIDGMTAGTFERYAVYVQGAEDTTIRNLKVAGGSTVESIVRLDNVTNFTLEDSTLDYRPVPAPRKACLRGFGKGIRINRVTFFGGGDGVCGCTAMTGADGGSGYIAGGILRLNRYPWLGTLSNRVEWEAAVVAVVSGGITDQADILRETVKRCPPVMRIKSAFVTLTIDEINVEQTVSERAKYLAQRAESVFTDCQFIDAPIRNSAGGVQRYVNCSFVGNLFGHWNEPVYPAPAYLLPGDEPRPAPVTIFDGCSFVSPMTRAAFEAFAKANRMLLNNVTHNGVGVVGSVA